MENSSTLEAARGAKARVLAMLRTQASLTGVGITRVGKGYGVKVNFASAPGPDCDVPEEVEGVPVRVEITGSIRASKK